MYQARASTGLDGFRYTERSCLRRDFGTTCGSGGTADALASGASWGNPVGVQILSSAPTPSVTLRKPHISRASQIITLRIASRPISSNPNCSTSCCPAAVSPRYTRNVLRYKLHRHVASSTQEGGPHVSDSRRHVMQARKSASDRGQVPRAFEALGKDGSPVDARDDQRRTFLDGRRRARSGQHRGVRRSVAEVDGDEGSSEKTSCRATTTSWTTAGAKSTRWRIDRR